MRWTTPVNYMKRTAARDVELRGQKIREGDELVLFYASANRDEDVFDDPFAFRDRPQPEPPSGLRHRRALLPRRAPGAPLVSAALFSEIARRAERLELAGEPQRTASSFVAGIKHLPMRYRFARSG